MTTNEGGKLIRATLLYAGSSALVSGISVGLLPILTRAFSPEDFALMSLFVICVNALSALCGMGLHGAINVRYVDKSISFSDFVSTSIWLTLISACIVGVLMLFAQTPLVRLTELPPQWLYFALFAALANGVLLIRLAIWQAQRRAGLFATTRVVQALVDLTTTLVFIYVLHLGWQGRGYGVFAAFIAMGGFSLILLWHEGFLKPRMERDYVKNALGFGVPLLPHLLGSQVMFMSDRLIVTNLLGLETGGVYMAAAQIGLGLNLVVVSMNRAFSPWLLRSLSRNDQTAERRIVRLSYLYFLCLIGLGLLMCALCYFALNLILPPAYAEAQRIIYPIIFGNVFTGAYFVVTNYIFYANRTGWLSMITVAVGLTSVVLSYAFISNWGLAGAGYAFLISQIMLFCITWWVAQKAHKMPWWTVLTGR